MLLGDVHDLDGFELGAEWGGGDLDGDEGGAGDGDEVDGFD